MTECVALRRPLLVLLSSHSEVLGVWRCYAFLGYHLLSFNKCLGEAV